MKVDIHDLTNHDTTNEVADAREVEAYTQRLADEGKWNSDDGYRLPSAVTAIEPTCCVVYGGQLINALLALGQDWVHEDDLNLVDTFHNVHHELLSLLVPVGDLTLDPRNARTHGPRNLEVIRDSLQQFSQRQPIVVQKDGMIVRAGNARLTVARELGWTHIAALVCDEPEANATAYALMDNKSAELAEWDDEFLTKSLLEIRDVDDSLLDYVGFEREEITQHLDASEFGAESEPSLGGDAPGDPGHYSVLVRCENQEDQHSLIEQLEAEGRKCKAVQK